MLLRNQFDQDCFNLIYCHYVISSFGQLGVNDDKGKNQFGSGTKKSLFKHMQKGYMYM